MRVFTVITVLLLLAPSTPALSQEYAGEDRVRQEPGNVVLVSDDVNDIGSRADAVLIARYVGASGDAEDRGDDGESAQVVTTMRFVVQEILKSDPRLPGDGQLDVKDTTGGGEYTKSRPHKVLKLSQTSQLLQAGDTYFLYLAWFEPLNAFTLIGGPTCVFNLTGEKVTSLSDALALGKKAPKMEKAAAIQALRDSAVAARPRPLDQ